ncbi:MAG: putative quinol monooxygenase [Reyranella sp.]|uniref:putative quinol monooxygenase n=1 Tax=Reyranella sp. TaxID=1929291 RepID=UPI003D0BA915
MTTLNTDSGVVTLINTFTVAPDNVDDLLEVLSRATEQTMRHMPGFISASFHVADDRRHVANYAQWRSKADFEAMLNSPVAQKHMKEAAGIAKSAQPLIYSLCQTYEA